MDADDLRAIILNSLYHCKSQPKLKAVIDSKSNGNAIDMDAPSANICNYFNKLSAKTENNKKIKLLSLSSDIGATIISFCNRRETMNAKFVSTDLSAPACKWAFDR